MAKKIGSREYGLELGTIIMQFFFKSKALHYGYWPEDLEVQFFNMGKAQSLYTEKIVELIPEKTKTILDIGCGTGVLTKILVERGYEVECISPSHFLAEETRKQVKGVTVYECKFEEFQELKKYDLLIFSESFQYIQLNQVFSLAKKILNTHGHILISDMFKTHPSKRGPIGGGHQYQDYLNVCEENKLQLIRDIDITQNVAPTFDILHDFSLNLLRPLIKNLFRIFSTNRPLLFKIFKWKFNEKLERFNRNFKSDRNGKGFKEYNTYRMMVWKQ